MIYLDNAATSWPKPESVYLTMDQFLRNRGGNAGHGSHSLASAAQQVIDETRLLTARFIGAPEVDRLIFTANCTDSINLALKGLLKPGDEVITSSLEHNAVMRPLEKLRQMGITVTQVPVSPHTGYTEPEILEKAITARTRLVAMIHISNVSGVVQPVGEYGAITRKHHVLLLVDAAQSVGHLRLDIVRDNIDLLAFSAHKGPLGPTGVGVLYISPGVNPDTLREGGTGLFSESGSQPEKYPQK
ncbi:MAG TPA: aminotransferase class V-fold PLP-dependent enzyme, partial [Dehalococcoidales bacterium]|nr:aminotransferase class V-fold PLP-dependent enzyme [Dehalococcoidales bacterium]